MPQQPMPGYFFIPQHIILVGASERPYSLGERILNALLSTPFQGKITPVNLRHKTVAGLKAYPNINRVEEHAELVIITTPPETYDTLLKACKKKKLHHVIIIQDWENLPPASLETAQISINRHHGTELNISVCNPAGIQIPTQGLNTGILSDFPAGRIALLTGQASISSEINALLHKIHQGISRHISLNYSISPTSSADWINRFGHNRHTRIAIIHLNPLENQRKLFSAIRQFTRHTPIILYCTHYADETERSILQYLSQQCNFIITFNIQELNSALHALLSDLKPSHHLNVLANTPIEWLQHSAQKLNINLTLPSTSPIHHGYIGSNPTPMFYRGAASSQLQQNQPLLTIITHTAEQNEHALTKALTTLQLQSENNLLISSPFSDGLLQFPSPKQALQTLFFSNQFHSLKQLQLNIAQPVPMGIQTPSLTSTTEALHNHNFSQLAELLYLPAYQPQIHHSAIQITLFHHVQYGILLSTHYQGRTLTILPPFTTLDAEQLTQFIEMPYLYQNLYQYLYSFNTLIEKQIDLPIIIIHISHNQLNSDFRPSETANSTENVLTPYPTAQYFTLNNGQPITIRAFTPEDAQAKQQFIRHLSPQARYTRFMTQTNELPIPTLARLSNLDYYSEGAWIAQNNTEEIIGISRFSKISREECEFGITLAEHIRGTGLAFELMQQIIRLATQQGYISMSAEILKNNIPMLKLAEKLGFILIPSESDTSLYQAKLNLTPPSPIRKLKFRQ